MKIQSVEPLVADKINGQFKEYGLTYYLEQQSFNSEIDDALSNALSKSGGAGGNRPDAKLLLQTSELSYWPVMVEYKGYKDKLEKLTKDGDLANEGKRGLPNYNNIAGYAVNGAVHYSKAILQYTSFTDVIAIGVTGWLDESSQLQTKIAVYYVGKTNYGAGQKIGEFEDVSFLKPQFFDDFVRKVRLMQLSPSEIKRMQRKREDSIEDALTRINENLYNKQQNLSALSRIHLVSASIMSNLGVPNKVAPLSPSDLHSSIEEGETDGDIMMRKIKAFLKERKIPEAKQKQIISSLSITIADDQLSKPNKGTSLLKEIFTEVVNDLGGFYKVGVDSDFTGKLFNIMFRWLSFAGDDQNDVVLTPRYVAQLMVKLTRVDRNSRVWDFATGTAGLLVAAMHQMVLDAQTHITSEKELEKKITSIRSDQILGIEVLPEIYMLAVLNMILMGDGSSNILNQNSLSNFDGMYGYDEKKPFNATAFILNPPYSAPGNGMIFVSRGIKMMDKGYATVIIQDSAGNGKASSYNQSILSSNTLLASIKMPIDLFIGKSSVQTSIYVFRVGEAHKEQDRVRFIDFSNDGYKRANRKKAKASSNLIDKDNAVERYEEVANLVLYGKSQLNLLTENEYVEDTIALSGDNFGNDWNFDQHKHIDPQPTMDDFKYSVANYISWDLQQLLIRPSFAEEVDLTEDEENALRQLTEAKWGSYNLEDLFGKSDRGSRLKSDDRIKGDLPFITAGEAETGVSDFIANEVKVYQPNTVTIDMFGSAKYRGFKYGADDHVAVVHTEKLDKLSAIFVAASINKVAHAGQYSYSNNFYASDADLLNISLPIKNGTESDIDYKLMNDYISAIHKIVVKKVEDWSFSFIKNLTKKSKT